MDLDQANRFNAAIEFHDSDVMAIRQESSTFAVISLRAYVHRSDGSPAFDAGTGWVQEVVMLLSDYQLVGDLPKLPCSLSHGSVSAGRSFYDGVVPIPMIFVGDTQMSLSFVDGCEPQIKASAICIHTAGSPTFIESVSGSGHPANAPAKISQEGVTSE